MANLSQLILPVKDTITGEVTSQTFDLAGSGGDNTNFIGTREAYDALPASEKEQYDSMDFTNYQDGASYDPVPVKASHNIVESGGVYNAIANSNNVVAPVELTLTSTRAYAVGDQFVYDGLLYKATAAIGVGGAITIGTNCEVAPCVTEQIGLKELNFDTNVTANAGFTIVDGDMYEQDGVVTIELYGNSSTAITGGFVANVLASYRPSDYRVVGACMARLNSWDVGVSHPAVAWVFPNGNIYVSCDTACKGFVLRVQYRPI